MAATAQGNNVVLIENLRQRPKYLVDKEFLDGLLHNQAGVLATLEILSDPELTTRLLKLGRTIDAGVRSGHMRLYTMDEVFAPS
jgi:hypothetical protein